MSQNLHAAILDNLRIVLADTYAQLAQTQLAHWNVRGANFFQLHTVFEEQYRALFEEVDETAERIRALDEPAFGGLSRFAELSSIKEMSSDFLSAEEYVTHLLEGYTVLIESLQKLKNASQEADDEETEDFAIARIRSYQKTVWMLKSRLKM